MSLYFRSLLLAGCTRLLVSCALLFFVLPTWSQALPPRIPVIVDSDMGTDDWLALAYITRNANFELLGITIAGNGLTPCPHAAFNAQYLLEMTQTQAPVSCSSPWPMNGYASYPKPWREGSITMLGENPTVRNPQQSFEDAPRLLARLLEQSKEPVDIIAIGALTNIATVLQTYPKLKSKIRKITSMGGAIGIPGNLRVHGFTENHTNRKAEWNYYIDPVAAKLVFDSGVPLFLVPLNATNQAPLTPEFVERVRNARNTPAQSFVLRTFERIASSTSTGEYYHWDPLAAVVASDPDLCVQRSRMRLTVASQRGADHGLDNGQPWNTFPLLAFDGRKRHGLSESQAGAVVASKKGLLIDVCMKVDTSAFEAEFIRTISR